MSFFSCTSSAQENNLRTFVAYNNITFNYEIVYPQNFSRNNNYELAILFTETALVDNEWEKASILVKEEVSLENTVLILPKVPLKNKHWKSHPIHHALNDLMDNLGEEFNLETSKFHFIGYKAGHNVAQTYADMSSEYIKSLSVVHSSYWKDNKQEWFDALVKKRIPIYVYEENEADVPLNISNAIFVKSNSIKHSLKIIDTKIREI